MLGSSPIADLPLASQPFSTASGGVTGTLATTNANDTLAASGNQTNTGTLARTNANDTLAASGTQTNTGTLATTNADDTLSASGATGSITGTLAYTNADDTLVASGTGPAAADEEPAKGWPKTRKQRRAEKRRERLEAKQARYEGISAEVARFEQAKRLQVVAPQVEPIEAVAAPEAAPIPEAPSVEVTAIQAILDAWQRIEDRQAAEAQQLAAQEIARIQALQDEELMIVTMIAALA